MGALLRSLADKRIAVVVGSGGVGKTSVAAAIALSRAMDGGRVLVCTIDPARRLASALGLASLGNTEARDSRRGLRQGRARAEGSSSTP